MAPGAISRFGAPMFEPEIFRTLLGLHGAPIVIRRPGNCAPLCPLVMPVRSRGHFRYGVERAKCFVNVHLYCIVSNIERISEVSSLPLGKVSADAHASDLNFFKFLAFFRHVLVVSYLQIQ